MDNQEKTNEFMNKLGLTFPVAYDMDAIETARITGAFYEQEKKYLHPTNYIIRPDKTIELAVYSSGAVGRLVAPDALALIKYYKSLKKN